MNRWPIHSYDPQALGARCDLCPLASDRLGGPVPPEIHQRAIATVIAEAPAKHEVREGAPFRGPSGWETNDAVRAAGYGRSSLCYLNLLACQLPKAGTGDSDFTVYMRKVRAAGSASPVECCAPRLRAELAVCPPQAQQNLLTMGDAATKTLLRTQKGILALSRMGGRETEVLGEVRRVVPVMHAAHALRQKALRPTFWEDIARACRYFTGTLNWPPFETLYPDGPEDLRAFLADAQRFWGYDIETTKARARNIRPLEVRLRCLSVARGDGTAVMVVPFLSVDGRTHFYPEGALHGFREEFREAFADLHRLWIGWNNRWFDTMALQAIWGFAPVCQDDVMMKHRQAFPGLSHRLEFAGTTLTDVSGWKTAEDGADSALVSEDEFQVDEGEDEEAVRQEAQIKDEELWVRNATDSIVTVRVVPPIMAVVGARYPDGGIMPGAPHWTLDDHDAHAQDFCLNLHRQGVWVNQEYRQRAEDWLGWVADGLTVEIRQAVYDLVGSQVWAKADPAAPFNPGSDYHIRHLLYDLWRLTPREETKTGADSVNAKVMRLHILEDGLDDARVDLLYQLRRFKKTRKLLTSYVRPVAAERWKTYKRKAAERLPGFLSPDGRVRAAVNAHGTKTLRYSMDKPPMQIVPREIRSIFAAPPGRVLFGADADQMHPRIAAALWGIARLQEAFDAGEDLYSVIAEIIYPKAYRAARGYASGKKPRKDTPAGRLRENAKTIFLAMLYGAAEKTVHENSTKAEDVSGRIAAKDITYRMVCAACDAIHRAMPEILAGWEATAEEAERNGLGEPDGIPYLRDPIGGWRGDFPDGVRDSFGNIASDVINFKILTAEAVLMHLREWEILKAIPWEAWGPGTGIILQTHDSETGECPLSEITTDSAGTPRCRPAEIVADCLTYTVPVLGGMKFTAEAVWGPTLLEA